MQSSSGTIRASSAGGTSPAGALSAQAATVRPPLPSTGAATQVTGSRCSADSAAQPRRRTAASSGSSAPSAGSPASSTRPTAVPVTGARRPIRDGSAADGPATSSR
ncbi:hypothetical protein ATKI12_0703 [Kitasatospora sp. Ki12]